MFANRCDPLPRTTDILLFQPRNLRGVHIIARRIRSQEIDVVTIDTHVLDVHKLQRLGSSIERHFQHPVFCIIVRDGQVSLCPAVERPIFAEQAQCILSNIQCIGRNRIIRYRRVKIRHFLTVDQLVSNMLRSTRQHIRQVELHTQFATRLIITLQNIIARQLCNIEIHDTHIVCHSFHLSICQFRMQDAVVVGSRSKMELTFGITEERELHR